MLSLCSLKEKNEATTTNNKQDIHQTTDSTPNTRVFYVSDNKCVGSIV